MKTRFRAQIGHHGESLISAHTSANVALVQHVIMDKACSVNHLSNLRKTLVLVSQLPTGRDACYNIATMFKQWKRFGATLTSGPRAGLLSVQRGRR